MLAQLVKANNAPEKGTGWHHHGADFHIVFMLKGWARFMYEDEETLVAAGDCVHQRPGIVHYLFDYSPDMEYLEVVGPADFTTVDAEGPCAGAGADALELSPPGAPCTGRRRQNSMSSSSISSGSSLRRGDPLDHLGHRQDVRAIGRALAVELHVVGDEARDHRRVHRVGHRRCLPNRNGPP